MLIGGYAVSYHGQPRATKDIDFLVAIDAENRKRLANALSKFGVSKGVVDAAASMLENDVVYFGVKPLRVDILGSATGIEFESAYLRAVRISVDTIPIAVIGLDDLIINKRASGRPQDLQDCKMLELAKRAQERLQR